MYSKSKRKEKRNINNNLAILPSHDIGRLSASANFLLIAPFRPLLNSSMRGLLS